MAEYRVVLRSAVCIVLLFCAAARGTPQYNIVALDVLPGGVDSLAFGLNDQGQIVGDSRLDRSTHVGQSRPVVWDDAGIPHELWDDQNLGASLADINNAGQIVGRYGSGSGIPVPGPGVPLGRGFVWDAANGLQDLGLAPVGNSIAVAINDSRQVVGTSETLETIIDHGVPITFFGSHPFVWDESNGIRDLGSLGGFGGFANAINNLGQVVGYSLLPNEKQGAFIWDEVQGMRQLPTMAGGSAQAVAINDLGQILGSEIGVGGVIWDLQTGIQHIVPGGSDLNNNGQAVGGSIIWDRMNGLRSLSDLIPTNTGWQIEFAFAINDAGDIVGYGLLDGQIRGFLMTPVPEPSSILLLAVFVIPIGFAFSFQRNRQNRISSHSLGFTRQYRRESSCLSQSGFDLYALRS